MDARVDFKYAIYVRCSRRSCVVVSFGSGSKSVSVSYDNDLFTAYPQQKMGLFICEGPTKVLSIKI